MMILDEIVEIKRQKVETRKKSVTIEDWKKEIHLERNRSMMEDTIFEKAFRGNRLSVIGEIKKASPSKGLLVENFEPVKMARAYVRAGAAAISVLTEEDFFLGHNDILKEVKRNVSIPVLRKDFIIDPWQIYESKVIGAHAVLLIAAILTEEELRRYQIIARILGMASLVEVHNEEELEKGLGSGALMIGINNRNLHTFTVSLDTTAKLIHKVPKDKIIISESGIQTEEDMVFLRKLGAHGVLIGESFMRASSIEEKMSQLTGTSEAI